MDQRWGIAIDKTLHMWNMSYAAQTEQLPPDPLPAGHASRPCANMAPRLRPLEGDRPEIGHALSGAHALERAGLAGIPLARPRASGASAPPRIPVDFNRIGART